MLSTFAAAAMVSEACQDSDGVISTLLRIVMLYVILGNSANRMPLRPDVSRPHLGGALDRTSGSGRPSTIV